MMSKNTDYTNNLLNQLAYVDLCDNYTPGDNLIVVLRDSGADDLADSLEAAGYGDYVIKDYENQNATNGFAAIAIEDPNTGDVGISYRGTENLPKVGESVNELINGNAEGAANQQIDMIDNISTAVTGDSAQAQEALDFFNRNQSATGDNYLYGHSKGGELAQEVYVENFNKIKEVHIINPQPINWASLTPEQSAALKNGKIDAVVIDGDLVWLLGGVPYSVRIVENNGSAEGEFFGPHNLQSATYDPKTGEAIIEKHPYLDYLGQALVGAGLNIVITVVQGGYAVVDTAVEWVKDAYDFFTEDVPEAARRFWESVNKAWQDTKDYIGDVAENVKDFFSDVADAAKNWWDEHFGDEKDEKKSSGSNGPCRIRVDAQCLRQIATQMMKISQDIDKVETGIDNCRKALHGFGFAGTVAVQTSLLVMKKQIDNLSDVTAALSDKLVNVAETYDQVEKQTLSVAKS